MGRVAPCKTTKERYSQLHLECSSGSSELEIPSRGCPSQTREGTQKNNATDHSCTVYPAADKASQSMQACHGKRSLWCVVSRYPQRARRSSSCVQCSLLHWQECFQFFVTCKRTNSAKNATYCVKLGEKRRESSKRNYYIISPRVVKTRIFWVYRKMRLTSNTKASSRRSKRLPPNVHLKRWILWQGGVVQ